MKVRIKKIDPNAVIPQKAHIDDFAYDVVATSCTKVGEFIYKYGLGFALELVRTKDTPHVNLSIDLRPRSSVWKTGLVLTNCEGTIDEGYRGEISAVFYKVAEGEPYKVGDRIGQIKIGFTLPMEFEEMDTLSDTERGAGGYGSTGR